MFFYQDIDNYFIFILLGTVVAGVGTIQAPIIGTLAAFAAAPVAMPLVVAGGAIGAAINIANGG